MQTNIKLTKIMSTPEGYRRSESGKFPEKPGSLEIPLDARPEFHRGIGGVNNDVTLQLIALARGDAEADEVRETIMASLEKAIQEIEKARRGATSPEAAKDPEGKEGA